MILKFMIRLTATIILLKSQRFRPCSQVAKVLLGWDVGAVVGAPRRYY